jgi:hypothetical protein
MSPSETVALLTPEHRHHHHHHQGSHDHELEVRSIVESAVSKEERQLGSRTVGERLPYNDYTTIDWLHDLVRMPLFPPCPPIILKLALFTSLEFRILGLVR